MTFLPVCELKEGMVVESKAAMPPYLVVSNISGTVTFQNETETYSDNDGMVKVLDQMPKVTFMRNLDSRVIHATVNGRTLCNVRHSQDSETVDKFATCEKCIKLFEK